MKEGTKEERKKEKTTRLRIHRVIYTFSVPDPDVGTNTHLYVVVSCVDC